MKKKILAFIFGLCLIIPCMFIFSACGDEPPADDPTKWKTVTEATCTTEGLKKRTIDGNEETEKIPALGHKYGDWSITLNETCTTNGSKQQTCERCNDIKTETILAHHTLDGTTKFDKTQHWEHCTKCTDKVNAENHEFKTQRTPLRLYDIYGYDDIGYTDNITCMHCDLNINSKRCITQSTFANSFAYDTFVLGLNSIECFQTENLFELVSSKYMSLNYTIECGDNYITMKYKILSKNYAWTNFLDDEGKLVRIEGLQDNEPWFNCNATYSYSNNGYTITISEIGTTAVGTFEFNNKHQLLSHISTQSNTTYTYENGILTSGHYISGSTDESWEYKNSQYDSNGNRTYGEYYENGEFKYNTYATYDSNNRLIHIENYDSEQELKAEKELVYSNDILASVTTTKYSNYGNATTTAYIVEYTNNSFSLKYVEGAGSYSERHSFTWQDIVTTNIPE